MEKYERRPPARLDEMNPLARNDLEVPALRRRPGEHPLMDCYNIIRMGQRCQANVTPRFELTGGAPRRSFNGCSLPNVTASLLAHRACWPGWPGFQRAVLDLARRPGTRRLPHSRSSFDERGSTSNYYRGPGMHVDLKMPTE
jgi:hypothetical protein